MVTSDTVWGALRTVSDPEYPLSIVDMGMVYDVRVEGDTVDVSMTFTSIGCPAMDMIVGDVREAVMDVPGIDRVEVEIVWSPPWTKRNISARGKKVLAMFGVVN